MWCRRPGSRTKGGVRGGGPQGASCQEIWHQGQGWRLTLTQPSDGDDKRPETPLKLPLHSSAFTALLTLLLVNSICDLIHFYYRNYIIQNMMFDTWYVDKHWPIITIFSCLYTGLYCSAHCVLFVFSVCYIQYSFASVVTNEESSWRVKSTHVFYL